MIDVKKQKVNEVIQGMHDAMKQKVKRGKKSKMMKDDILLENRIFSVICHDYDMGPTQCAEKLNDRYGYEMTGDEVIRIFRNRRMANPVERKMLFQWAGEVADLFAQAIEGKKEAFEKFEKKRKLPAIENTKHDSQGRIAIVMIYEKYSEIDVFDDMESLHSLGNSLGKYFLYDVADVISEVYNFPQNKESKKKEVSAKPKKEISYEQALRRIETLENQLERSNFMLQDLQEEFDEQLEASKIKELADFFARLNSEKYGCILDELLVIRKGVDELRKSNYELPIEINGLLIMVKKLIQFVRDSHIEPMMKVSSLKEVTAAEVEFCNYEGSPFTSPEETKKVRVVSPGWVYKDKELQISRPKVREEV